MAGDSVDIGPDGVVAKMAGFDSVIVAGATVPTSGTPGFSPSSIFIHVDATTAADRVYVNTGSKASCTFTSVTDLADTSFAADTISEITAAVGVTIDSLLVKDGHVEFGAAGRAIFGTDGGTYLYSSGTDEIEVVAGGAADFRFSANTFTSLSGSSIATNTITETTATSGVTIDGLLIKDGGIVDTSRAVTATVGGGTTGLITAGTSFVTVTSDNADKQISLPAATVGDVIRILVGATGCELISAVAADKVNDVTVGATNEAALTAENLYRCEYVATNKWVVVGYTKLGAVQAALVPDSL